MLGNCLMITLMQRHNDIGRVTATNNSDNRDKMRAHRPGPGGLSTKTGYPLTNIILCIHRDL